MEEAGSIIVIYMDPKRNLAKFGIAFKEVANGDMLAVAAAGSS